MKTKIYNEGQLIKERLSQISDYIYNNPELGNEEYKAVENEYKKYMAEHPECDCGCEDHHHNH